MRILPVSSTFCRIPQILTTSIRGWIIILVFLQGHSRSCSSGCCSPSLVCAIWLIIKTAFILAFNDMVSIRHSASNSILMICVSRIRLIYIVIHLLIPNNNFIIILIIIIVIKMPLLRILIRLILTSASWSNILILCPLIDHLLLSLERLPLSHGVSN